jgi:hypothetical protein
LTRTGHRARPAVGFRDISIVYELTDFIGQHCVRERFGDNGHSRIKMSISDDGIFGEACDELHLQSREGATRCVGDLPSIQAAGYWHLASVRYDVKFGPLKGAQRLSG